MAARKRKEDAPPQLVRKSVMIDPAKLEQAKKVLGASSDAEVLRLALDHLLSHFTGHGGGEEE
jgi:hypothetical protein